MATSPGTGAPADGVERAVDAIALLASSSFPVANQALAASACCTRFRNQSGCGETSLLRMAIHSERARRIPRFTAWLKPVFSPSSITSLSARLATATESSVLPLSTTMTRSMGWDWRASSPSSFESIAEPFQLGMMTVSGAGNFACSRLSSAARVGPLESRLRPGLAAPR